MKKEIETGGLWEHVCYRELRVYVELEKNTE